MPITIQGMRTAMLQIGPTKYLMKIKVHLCIIMQRINYSNDILFLADQINNYILVYQPVESVTNILFSSGTAGR